MKLICDFLLFYMCHTLKRQFFYIYRTYGTEKLATEYGPDLSSVYCSVWEALQQKLYR